MHAWRRSLLRAFGGEIAADALIYPDCIIYAPWKLHVGSRAVIGDGVHCYNVADVRLERGAIVSQRAHLCTASHDMTQPAFPLIAAPIIVGAFAWVASEAFVGPGVSIGEGGVVGARAVARRDVEQWQIVAGNPARYIRDRPQQPADDIERLRVI